MTSCRVALIVMLHGWPDTCRLWDSTVEALKDRYCCVRFTLPGFDLAAPPRMTSLDDMCEWLHTVVDQVSPGVPVTLLLHDWGCIFGYEFAARFPDRVARLVAVDIGDPTSLQMLYVYGERKPFMFHSPQWLAALAQRPGNAVQAFKTGHWVMLQQPQAFNQCVRAWLQASDKPSQTAV